MGQHHIGVPFHSIAPELEICSFLERRSDDGRRRDAQFFELDGVVHTAQRTGPSTAQAGDRDVHLPCHLLDDLGGRWLGVVFLAPDDQSLNAVAFAQSFAHGLEDDVCLLFGIVQKSDNFSREIGRTGRQKDGLLALGSMKPSPFAISFTFLSRGIRLNRPYLDQSCLLARAAPSVNAWSLAHIMDGWTRAVNAPWENPQSDPAITLSRPNRRA